MRVFKSVPLSLVINSSVVNSFPSKATFSPDISMVIYFLIFCSPLPCSALGKVKRISVRNSDDEETESASIFGTEMTTEDQETGKLDDYTYELLDQGKYRGREVAVIESTPKPHRLSKSSYGKTRTWVDREKMVRKLCLKPK